MIWYLSVVLLVALVFRGVQLLRVQVFLGEQILVVLVLWGVLALAARVFRGALLLRVLEVPLLLELAGLWLDLKYQKNNFITQRKFDNLKQI